MMGSSPDLVKPKTKIGICCFSAKPVALGERTKTGWLRIRMCPSGVENYTRQASP
jgi:hypothetical protein